MPDKLLFLSYAGIDTEAAERIVNIIEGSPEARKDGLKVWFEKRDLKPNIPWEEQVKEVIQNRSTAFAVYIGEGGAINWPEREVEMALSRLKTNPSYPFIPILTSKSSTSRYLPPFASHYQSVKDIESNTEELNKLTKIVISAEEKHAQHIVPMPFVGLRSFDESNANLFFGREKEVGKLLDMLRENRLLMIIGGSGSGKSSLIRAGLTPAFRGGLLGNFSGKSPDKSIWSVIGTRPGERPFFRLAYSIDNVASEKGVDAQTRDKIRDWVCSGKPDKVHDAIVEAVPENAKILMVIDHFEELFIETEEDVRRNYIDCILDMIDKARTSNIYVVINIQYDYYNLCSRYKNLYRLLESNSKEIKFKVPMMGQEGLRSCIEKPLEIAGISGCDVFVDAVLNDVMSLPNSVVLFQVALAESWRRRENFDGDLLKAYVSIGRLSGALAKAADDFYEKLCGDEKVATKQIFLRLIHLSETGKAAKRIASKKEFRDAEWKLLEKFTSEEFGHLVLIKKSRIFDKDGSNYERETAEISHDALITHWPKYQEWIWEESDYKRIHDHVIVKSKTWHHSGRKKKFLARGHILEECQYLLSNRREWLSKMELSFINVSRVFNGVNKYGSMLSVFIVIVGGIFFFSLKMELYKEKQILTKYLIHSAENGDTEAIETFIKLGIDVNARDDEGNTVLMYVAKEGHESVVRKLLKHEHIVYDAKNEKGETALMFAANSNEAVLKLLLEKGADINEKNEEGETALMYVKDVKTANFLLGKGLRGRFKAYGQNLVYDSKNNIDWFAGPGKNTSWDDAHAWIKFLNDNNFSGGGWRLPKPSELKSLYKPGLGERNMIPFLKTTAWLVWSDKPGDVLSYKCFNFGVGKALYLNRSFSDNLRGFAVRSKK